MMSQYYFQQIRKLKASGLNKSEIAKKLNIDWKTVSKYWESNTPPVFVKSDHRRREDPTEPHANRIATLLDAIEDVRAVDIYERIRKEGYSGCLRTLQRRIEKIQGERPKERFFEQEYEPGEQVQFDFKEKVELVFTDGSKMVNLHFGTLPCSGKTFVKGYPFLNFECFIDGIHSFFDAIGGLTKNIRIDNLSPCVKAVLKGRKREWTDYFKTAIDYYGFGVLPCTPAKGNEKGHVERDIQTFARRIRVRSQIDGKVFKDWEDLNQWLLAFMKEQQVNIDEKFNKESEFLLPLPPKKVEVLCRIDTYVASAYGTIRLGRSVYSVPDSAVGMACRVVPGPYDVKIYRTNKLKEPIAVHPRLPDGQSSILLEHVLPSLIRKPQAMIRWTHRAILFPIPIFTVFYQYLKRIDQESAEREFLRVINLIHHTHFGEISTAIELVMNDKSLKPFEDLKDLLLVEKRPCTVFSITDLLGQKPLKPKLSDYDSFIPKQGA
jgi:transposase